MADGALSLQEYLRSPIGTAPRTDPLPAQTLSALGRFMPVYANAFFIQWKNVKRTVRTLAEQGVLPNAEVRLIPKLRATAYTIDNGPICFSLGALLTRSSAVTMTVFCHELAHACLSHSPDYPALKRLNKDFLVAFSSQKTAYLMSPIEVFAMVGALDFMAAVCASLKEGRRKSRLERLIALERQKLDVLQVEISMLQIPDGIDLK